MVKRGDKMKQALILVNSRNKRSNFSQRLFDICKILSKQEYEVNIYLTKNKRDLIEVVAQRNNVDLLVVAGGDGTMNEVLCALGDVEEKPQIMYFPTGTVNDFGTSLKIPHNFDDQLNILKKGETKKVDSGRVNEMYFNYICAFGPFTRASYLTSRDKKNRFGKWAYFKKAAEDLPKINRSYYLDIEIDGEKIEGEFALCFIINSTSVAGFKRFLKNDSIDDGYFNILLVNSVNAKSFRKGVKYLIKGMEESIRDEDLIFRKFKKLKITTPHKITWTIDGERGPVGSIEIEVLKHNLEMMIHK